MRVVLTGGPHSGKSTLLEALARRGVPTVPEAALSEIDALVARWGADEARVRRKADMRTFQLAVSRRQARLEATLPEEGLVVLDRGVVDGLAYCAHHGFAPPPELREAADRARYDVAILCELILPFAPRPGTGRTSDEASARALESLVADAYVAHGVPLVRLPAMPVEARVEAVLAEVVAAPAVVAAAR